MFNYTPLILAGVHGLQYHPVREELVQEIKAKTSKWTPMEVEENHFRHVPVGEIQNTLGSLDASNGMLTKFDKSEKKELTNTEAFMNSFHGILNIGEAWNHIMGRSLLQVGDDDEEDYNIDEDIKN